MEANKQISVHMSVDEYEQYKKYLHLADSSNTQIFFGSSVSEIYGRVTNKIYSQKEVVDIINNELSENLNNALIELREKQVENYAHRDKIMQLKKENQFLQQKVAAYEAKPNKTFWQSLWS